MESVNEDYAAFEMAMDRDKVYLDLDYDEICAALGIDRNRLDRMLREELGYGGEELVAFYRSNFC